MKKAKDGFEFECSGRFVYANRQIVGLRLFAEDKLGRVFEGYDGEIIAHDDDWNDVTFTSQERKELAETMSAAWLEWGRGG